MKPNLYPSEQGSAWGAHSVSRRQFLRATAATSGALSCSLLNLDAAPARLTPEEERQKIEQALPATALVKPLQPRKLLIFDLNVGYGGHPSIQTANLAFKRMGEKTGAFETVISHDPLVFRPGSLRNFDAVFFNNTVGNCFTEPELRESLVDFVYGGGGLLGVHGTSVAFTKWPGAIEDWPEFGVMLGARGANHRDPDEHVYIKLEDRRHPLNQAIGGKDFDYRDEFFRVHEPYSRKRVRVLLSIDNAKTPPEGQARGNVARADNDYALAWVRQYGRGRVFYSTIAHNPYVFWDPKMLWFYLGAVQFALGDLPAPTTPSARLTPAVSAQERLGWRLGMMPDSSIPSYFYDTIDATAKAGLLYMGTYYGQPLNFSSGRLFDVTLQSNFTAEIRRRLDAAGVRLLTCHVGRCPGPQLNEVFFFARKMGIETLIGEPNWGDMDDIEKLCEAYQINYAFLSAGSKVAPKDEPKALAKFCEGRNKWIGACGFPGAWMRAGLDPVESVRLLGNRLMTVHWHEPAALPGSLLQELARGGVKPTMFGIQPWMRSAAVPESIEAFNKISLELVPPPAQ